MSVSVDRWWSCVVDLDSLPMEELPELDLSKRITNEGFKEDHNHFFGIISYPFSGQTIDLMLRSRPSCCSCFWAWLSSTYFSLCVCVCSSLSLSLSLTLLHRLLCFRFHLYELPFPFFFFWQFLSFEIVFWSFFLCFVF